MNETEDLERECIKLRQQVQSLDEFNLSLYRVYRAASQFIRGECDKEHLINMVMLADEFIGKN